MNESINFFKSSERSNYHAASQTHNYLRTESGSNSPDLKSRNLFTSGSAYKIKEIQDKIHNLTVKSHDLSQTLENIKHSKVSEIVDKGNSNNEYSILKSDNIIFREEIAKLGEINRHYEEELQKQRNKK